MWREIASYTPIARGLLESCEEVGELLLADGAGSSFANHGGKRQLEKLLWTTQAQVFARLKLLLYVRLDVTYLTGWVLNT